MQIINTYEKLLPYTIIKRKNRLSALVKNQSGKQELAHLTNTGRLYDLIFPGNKVLCMPNKNIGKTTVRIVAAPIKNSKNAILIDPGEQSRAFVKAAENSLIPWLKGWHIKKPEIKIADSRIDFLIESSNDKQRGYMEVKSAAIFNEKSKTGSFPDCPTERGQKHVKTLCELTKDSRCVMVFLVQHPDAESFSPNTKADPTFSKLLKQAASKGVEVRATKMYLKEKNVVLVDPDLPVFV